MFSIKTPAMKVEIEKEDVIFDEFFKVKRAQLRHEKFDGGWSNSVRRYSFEKSNAVAIILYHMEKDAILLVKQHRYPPMIHQEAWVTEIVAGGLKQEEDPWEAVQRETVEEVGYLPQNLELIHDFYVSPGVFTERIKLFYAEISEEHRSGNGGGLDDEDEDIQLVWVPSSQLDSFISSGEIIDAKTLIALYYFRDKHKN